ncbi:WD40 repeat domain-containing protein, partial [Streptomyces sp. T-3]|nr:WD40 repeat domain-containing protein [Streptomyces sp. T-3]
VSRRTLLVGGLAAAATAGTAVGVPLLLREKDKDSGTSGSSSGSSGGAGASGSSKAEGIALSGPRGVQVISFTEDGRTLLGAGDDATIWRWDVRSKRGTSTRIGIAKYIQATLFSPDLKFLIRAEENKVRLWDVDSGRVVKTFDGPPSPKVFEGFFQSIAVSPDGKTLIAASVDAGLFVWDIPSGRKADVQKGSYTAPLAISPDGKFLTTARPFTLRELPSLRRVATIDEEQTNREAAVFSPDSQLLAVAEMSGPIKLWNTVTQRHVVTLKGHKEEVNSLAFHPSAGLLASGSEDGTVRLWDTATGKTTTTFTAPDSVKAVAFSPDGKTLAAGPASGTTRLWQVP